MKYSSTLDLLLGLYQEVDISLAILLVVISFQYSSHKMECRFLHFAL